VRPNYVGACQNRRRRRGEASLDAVLGVKTQNLADKGLTRGAHENGLP